MSLEIKVLECFQVNEILNYEKTKLEHLDSQEQTFATWDAVWREEALEYYLSQGWSFGAWGAGGELVGYCLIQPLLFFCGMTQSLWVERMAFEKSRVGRELVEVVVGWGRSKHMQKVLFRQNDKIEALQGKWNLKRVDESHLEIPTTKIVVHPLDMCKK